MKGHLGQAFDPLAVEEAAEPLVHCVARERAVEVEVQDLVRMERVLWEFWVVVEAALLRPVAMRAHVEYPEVAVAVTIAGDYELEVVGVLPLAFFLHGKEVARQTSTLTLPLHP